jgi:VanZ family protein
VRWLPLALLTAAILYLSLIPSPPSDGLGWDKANHAVAMAAVTILAWFSARPAQRAVAFGALYGLGLGLLVELLQGWCTVSRAAEWCDLMADAVGVTAAVLLLIVTEPKMARNGRDVQ